MVAVTEDRARLRRWALAAGVEEELVDVIVDDMIGTRFIAETAASAELAGEDN